MKIFNFINGIFYILYGLFGLIQPAKMADLMGWTPSLLGLHEVRAIWAAVAAVGVILCLVTSQNRDQKLITMMIIFVTLAFALGRCVGLLLDGHGPTLTYIELGLEAAVVAFGALAMKLDKGQSA